MTSRTTEREDGFSLVLAKEALAALLPAHVEHCNAERRVRFANKRCERDPTEEAMAEAKAAGVAAMKAREELMQAWLAYGKATGICDGLEGTVSA